MIRSFPVVDAVPVQVPSAPAGTRPPARAAPPPQQAAPGPVAVDLGQYKSTGPVQSVDLSLFNDVAAAGAVARGVTRPKAPAGAPHATAGVVTGRVVGEVVPPPGTSLPRAAGNVVGRSGGGRQHLAAAMRGLRSQQAFGGGGGGGGGGGHGLRRPRSHADMRAERSRQHLRGAILSARALASPHKPKPRKQSTKTQFCGGCGTAFDGKHKFCMECGARRPSTSAAKSAAAAEPHPDLRHADTSHSTYMQRLQDEESAAWGDLSVHHDEERARAMALVAERRSKGASRRQNQKKKKRRKKGGKKKKKREKKRTSVVPEEDDGYMIL